MPDDVQNLWNIKFSHLDKALARIPRKADGTYAWDGLKVAHLDTGYTRHPALGFPPTGDSPWVRTALGRDFFDNKKDPKDPLIDTLFQPRGHGTRTSSALSGDNEHIKGFAPRLPIVPYRVADDSLIGRRTAAAIGKAIEHAIDENGCQIVAISLGFPVVDEGLMGAAIDLAYERGVMVIAACGQMTNKISYPAKSRRAIGIAGVERLASGKHKIYYPYEGYSRVDIFAPADPIWRADVRETTTWIYGTGDGTSYAVPHVVAAAAMWLTLRGQEIRAKYAKPWMRIEAFRQLLRLTQRPTNFKPPQGCLAKAMHADALVSAALPQIDEADFEEDLAADDRF